MKRSHEVEQAHRLARANLDFVMAHTEELAKADRTGKALRDAKNLLVLLKNGVKLSPGQLSYCDGLYEKVMKAMGLPSVGLHSDKHSH